LRRELLLGELAARPARAQCLHQQQSSIEARLDRSGLLGMCCGSAHEHDSQELATCDHTILRSRTGYTACARHALTWLKILESGRGHVDGCVEARIFAAV
jgi:hypothetical protein